MKIAIGITVGDIVKPATTSSIAMLAYQIGKNGHEFLYLSRQSPYLDANANDIFFDAQKNDVDYLLMIESDVEYAGEDDVISKMIAYNEDIVAGIYYKAKYPYRPLIVNFNAKAAVQLFPGAIPEKEPFYMDYAGSGFMLISRKVLNAFTPDVIERLGGPFDFYCEGRQIKWRQDLAFCWRLRDLGFKILVDPTISLIHWKDGPISKIHWDTSKKHMEETGVFVP